MGSFVEATVGLETPPSRAGLRSIRIAGAIVLIVVAATASYVVLSRPGQSTGLYNPFLISLLLVANLLAGSVLLLLVGRRIARRRAATSPVGGSGQLHVRLVGLFSLATAIPMVLVAMVASMLFQFGIQFWYSDQTRKLVETAAQLTSVNYERSIARSRENVLLAADNLSETLRAVPLDDPRMFPYFGKQLYYRGLSDGIVFKYSPRNGFQSFLLVNPDAIDVSREVTPAQLRSVKSAATAAIVVRKDRIGALAALPGVPDFFLYTATTVDVAPLIQQFSRSRDIQASYHDLLIRGRSLQLKFNAALILLSFLIVAIAVWTALQIADRLVRPVGELVGAARRVAGGDLTARVPDSKAPDEVGTLSRAFNTMTVRLQEQTAALDSRRALIEGVMAGVSAGVIAIAGDRTVSIANSSAARLLGVEALVGRPLGEVAPELDLLVRENGREAIVQLGQGTEGRTLAVRLQRAAAGAILTFDDITQQQLDQRRAAWADVARRIAHEIKNPLTPIQLAAERLQRRYGGKVEADDTTFARLTDTIVRSVDNLRRMVDEFSSFARMPKPMFRDEPLADLARQALFLHEVAHPGIRFELNGPEPGPHLVCDRRQIGQALTNLVKNAVEAIEAAGRDGGAVTITLDERAGRTCIEVADTGVGLPADRDRIVEPYVTTRARGTGLGLAIVKKIVEEHLGTMTLADREGGGAAVTLSFDTVALAALDQRDGDDVPAGEGQLAQLTRIRT